MLVAGRRLRLRQLLLRLRLWCLRNNALHVHHFLCKLHELPLLHALLLQHATKPFVVELYRLHNRLKPLDVGVKLLDCCAIPNSLSLAFVGFGAVRLKPGHVHVLVDAETFVFFGDDLGFVLALVEGVELTSHTLDSDLNFMSVIVGGCGLFGRRLIVVLSSTHTSHLTLCLLVKHLCCFTSLLTFLQLLFQLFLFSLAGHNFILDFPQDTLHLTATVLPDLLLMSELFLDSQLITELLLRFTHALLCVTDSGLQGLNFSLFATQ
ncbi:hypothetical protein HG530_013520 [Fusarium avenaceum]|nr:hypothetical protein HG530_013520 [Fusarium avenaceum]